MAYQPSPPYALGPLRSLDLHGDAWPNAVWRAWVEPNLDHQMKLLVSNGVALPVGIAWGLAATKEQAQRPAAPIPLAPNHRQRRVAQSLATFPTSSLSFSFSLSERLNFRRGFIFYYTISNSIPRHA